MRRFEKLKQLSISKSLKVTKLPSLWPLNASITDDMWGGRAPNNRMSLPCLSIMDDKGVPNQKHQTSDFGEDMKMNYTWMKKKKDRRIVEAPILEDQMKQPISKKGHDEVTRGPTFQILWVCLPSTIGGP